jgi:para-nitrobenzyl esterase
MIFTDAAWRMPAIRFAEARLGRGPVYLYESRVGLLTELIFDNTDFLLGSELNRALVSQVSPAWVAFARSGEPNHPGLDDWPGYTIEERATMRFDFESHAVLDPDREERLAWNGLL